MTQSKKLKSTKEVQLKPAPLKMLVFHQAKYLRGLGPLCVPFSVSTSPILAVGFVPLLCLGELTLFPFPCPGQIVLLHKCATVNFLTQLWVDGTLPQVLGSPLSSGSLIAVTLSATRECGYTITLPHQRKLKPGAWRDD